MVLTEDFSDSLKPGTLSGPPDIKLPITQLNPLLTCDICKGYLVGATTITECLHTFCKSCILYHVQRSIHCPKCHVVIHPSNPFVNMRVDYTWQDIMHKILPQVDKDERARVKEFYESRGIPCPPEESSSDKKTDHASKIDPLCLPENMLSLVLLYSGTTPGCGRYKQLPKKYIQVSCKATVGHVERFLRRKLNLNGFCQAKLFVDRCLLHESLSLENVRQIFFTDEKQENLIVMEYGIVPLRDFFTDRKSIKHKKMTPVLGDIF